MTREDAIILLKDIQNGIDETNFLDRCAIDMAIEALKEPKHGEWIPCSERLPEENICDDGYVEPSDYVLVFDDHGNYGVSRYWGNRRTKKENPYSFPDWLDLKVNAQNPIAWMPLPDPYKKEGGKK